MLNKNDVANALKVRAPQMCVSASTTTKNGREYDSVLVGSENVRSVFRMADLVSTDVESACDEILSMLDKAEPPQMDDILAKLADVDYVKEHLRVGLQRASSQALIKRTAKAPFDDLEEYLFVDFDGMATKSLMNTLVKDMPDAWEIAEANTFAECKIITMGEAFGTDIFDDAPFRIATNSSKSHGAAAVLNTDMLKAYADSIHADKGLVVLPSSIHECLLLPYMEEQMLEDLTAMVVDVNATEVAETEVLSNHAYHVTF